MRRSTSAILVAIALLAPYATRSFCTTVTIDPGVPHQTIDGFGGHNAANAVSKCANDLGLTMHRNTLNPDGTPEPGWSTLKALKNAGVKKFITSIWSPPAGMKTNNKTAGGGHLKASSRGAYADYLIKYIKDFKRNVGIDLYAISPQNEPDFSQYYHSCVYTAVEMRDFMKVLSPKLEAAGLNTKVFIPEDMAKAYARVRGYWEATHQDPVAAKSVQRLAVHGYAGDGITADSPGASNWRALFNLADKYGKGLWMTETSGYEGWEGAFKLAVDMFGALKHGNLAGWVWWRLIRTANWQDRNKCLLTGANSPTPKYFTSKNYFRYIRPGAVHVETTCPDTTVAAIAFVHGEQKTLTVILLNTSNTSKSVSLSGPGIPGQLKLYRSTSGENCADKGSVSSGSINLPRQSVNTLVATNYTTPVVAVSPRRAARRIVPAAGCRYATLYSIDGRLLKGKRMVRGASAGVCVLAGSQAEVKLLTGK